MRLVAYVEGFNIHGDELNASVKDINDVLYNIKFENKEELQSNFLYVFDLDLLDKEKRHYKLRNVYDPFSILSLEELDKTLKHFYKACPISYKRLRQEIEKHLNLIEDENIKKIAYKIYDENQVAFYLYPAATKFHHAYISGLAYHTYGMLELSKSFLDRYKVLNKDLIYAGIILHDIAKVYEFKRAYNTEYSLEGTLLGHLVMGSMMVQNAAKELKIEDEVVMLLEHIILSHHGQYQFGSPKKPLIAEAFVVSFLDNIDSKLTVIEEELSDCNIGEFTSQIGVIEKSKLYKHKLTKEI